jgi:hypothetical protein
MNPKNLLLLCSMMIAWPASAQFWRPADDLTTAVSQPATPGQDVKSYTVAPTVKPPSYPRRSAPERASYPVAIDALPGPSQKMANACFEAIRPSFFDPYSARMDRYQIYQMPDQDFAVGVWLNAKNRFGAYVGAKPYRCFRHNGAWTVGEGAW